MVWLRDYRRQDLPGDIIAGLTVAIMLVPQSMAYALLAGLPPVMGLYSAIFPVMVYGLLGSTRILTFGPTAITSVMVLSAIGHVAEPGSADYIVLANTLTLTLGFVFLLIGVLRLGFIVNFLSRPTLSAYVNAAALIILFSQVTTVLGIHAPRTARPYELFFQPIVYANQIDVATVLLGLASIGVLVYFKRGLPRHLEHLPLSKSLIVSLSRLGPLVVVVLGILLVYGLQLHEQANIAIIGDIPAGLPVLQWVAFDFSRLDVVLPGALAIAFVGFMEGVSTAKSLFSRRRQRLESNRELMAMGAANVVGVFTGGFAGTTSISRSAVNYAAGANTGLSSVIAGGILMLVVMFLTPVFYFLPRVVLATIIIVSVVTLINVASLRAIWRYSHIETLPFFVTFVGVLLISIEVGILSGIATSTLIYLYRTARPRVVVLGRDGYTSLYRDVTRYTSAREIPRVLIMRPDESLYFINMQHLDKQIRNAIAEYSDSQHFILVGNAINDIDASSLVILSELIADLQDIDVQVSFAELKDAVYSKLRRVGVIDELQVRVYTTTHEAVEATGQLPDDLLPI